MAILGPTSMSITKETEGCGNIYAMYGKLKVVPDMFWNWFYWTSKQKCQLFLFWTDRQLQEKAVKEQEEKIDTIRREIDMVGDTLNCYF